jgi:hypothetical protein
MRWRRSCQRFPRSLCVSAAPAPIFTRCLLAERLGVRWVITAEEGSTDVGLCPRHAQEHLITEVIKAFCLEPGNQLREYYWSLTPCSALPTMGMSRSIRNAEDKTIRVVIRYPLLSSVVPASLNHNVVTFGNEAVRRGPNPAADLGT